jgi:alkanesulfonate monooxygenase SsuD/methylene tetrahydromethanopterin reductase-like flavin-dependent oxidoreductase (luciferase family)
MMSWNCSRCSDRCNLTRWCGRCQVRDCGSRWLLGSSTFSAQLAAMLGLPFAFASHFAPAELTRALEVYRARFQPSEQLSEPYAMVGFNVFAADTDAEARRLITSLQQQFVSLRRGTPGPLPPPIDNMDDFCRRSSGRESSRRWPIPSSALRTPSSGGLKHSSPRPARTN